MFDLIIADESVKIKSRKAKQSKALKKLPAKYRIALSGYPIANRIEDIWSQVDWVNPGHLGSWWSFEDTYIIRGYFKEVAGYRNLNNLKNKLDHLYIRRLKKNVLDLPPKIYQTRIVELTDAEDKAYQKMKKEMYVEIKTMTEGDIIAKASTILVQLLRLSQIANGFITDKNLMNPAWFLNPAKLSELDDIVDEVITSDNKIVIWTRWVPCVHALKERYKKYNAVHLTGSVPIKERTENIQKFQEEDAKVFVGQMQSGGMGITLHAGNTEVFLDKAFISPSTILQSEDRLHRIGQKKTVVILSLIAKGTVDEKWEVLMKKKQSHAAEILRDEQFNMNKQQILEILE